MIKKIFDCTSQMQVSLTDVKIAFSEFVGKISFDKDILIDIDIVIKCIKNLLSSELEESSDLLILR